jgi:DNA-binding IclR family transcriptional regulator
MKLKENRSSSLDRGLDILELVLEKEEDIPFIQILNTLGIPRASLARILKTLTRRQYLSKAEKTGHYSIGLKLVQLSGTISGKAKIKEYASEAMELLWTQSKETIELVILDRDQLVLVDQILSQKGITVYNRVGSAYPYFHAPACGKIYLAYMDPKKRQEVLKKIGLPSITPYTITKKEILDQELQKIKVCGYATEKQELREGIFRIAAPILDSYGTVAGCICIAGFSYETDDNKERELAKMVIEAGKMISARLAVPQNRRLCQGQRGPR